MAIRSRLRDAFIGAGLASVLALTAVEVDFFARSASCSADVVEGGERTQQKMVDDFLACTDELAQRGKAYALIVPVAALAGGAAAAAFGVPRLGRRREEDGSNPPSPPQV